MQFKKLINDIEITEFLIQEIQLKQLKIFRESDYDGICSILYLMSESYIISFQQMKNFTDKYITAYIDLKGYLFQPFQIAPRVEFLQNLLKDLQKT